MISGEISMDDLDNVHQYIALAACAVSGSVGLGLLLALVIFSAS